MQLSFNATFETMTGEPRIPCGDSALPAPNAHNTAADNGGWQGRAAQGAARARARHRPGSKRRSGTRRIGARVLAWWRARQGAPAAGRVLAAARRSRTWRQPTPNWRAAACALALPVVLARDAALGFAEWTPGEAMVKRRDGGGGAGASCAWWRGRRRCWCRAWALTRSGYRLGYGGGFYDRTLAAAAAAADAWASPTPARQARVRQRAA